MDGIPGGLVGRAELDEFGAENRCRGDIYVDVSGNDVQSVGIDGEVDRRLLTRQQFDRADLADLDAAVLHACVGIHHQTRTGDRTVIVSVRARRTPEHRCSECDDNAQHRNREDPDDGSDNRTAHRRPSMADPPQLDLFAPPRWPEDSRTAIRGAMRSVYSQNDPNQGTEDCLRTHCAGMPAGHRRLRSL